MDHSRGRRDGGRRLRPRAAVEFPCVLDEAGAVDLRLTAEHNDTPTGCVVSEGVVLAGSWRDRGLDLRPGRAVPCPGVALQLEVAIDLIETAEENDFAERSVIRHRRVPAR